MECDNISKKRQENKRKCIEVIEPSDSYNTKYLNAETKIVSKYDHKCNQFDVPSVCCMTNNFLLSYILS